MSEDLTNFEKSLSAKISTLKNRQVSNTQTVINSDSLFITDIEREHLELSIERLRTAVSKEKEELENLKSNKRTAFTCERVQQARENLRLFDSLGKEKPYPYEVKEEILRNLEILKEVSSIGYSIDPKKRLDLDYLFHLNEDDLGRALHETNIMDFVNEVKENGWNVAIDSGEISVSKDGVPIAEIGMDFVTADNGAPTIEKK
tara:strand:+ start:8113 stop:8721 length:609 start_codon:yes stop_codon:yes gene_type:complete